MSDNKIQMPSSGGGLIRYSDENKSKLKFKPHYVIAAIIIVIIFQFILSKTNIIG